MSDNPTSDPRTPKGAAASIERAGVLLVAHGSRDPAWSAPFEALRKRIAVDNAWVEIAYLERMQPDVEDAARALAARGCRRAVVVPVFFGPGAHVREDLPKLVAAAESVIGGLALRLVDSIGEDPQVQHAIALRCLALAQES